VTAPASPSDRPIDPSLERAARAWIADDPDPETRAELAGLLERGEAVEIRARFAGLLRFGTAGLRAPLGAGPSRMNVAVVARAAVGVADWIRHVWPSGGGQACVVVGFDARHRSRDFAAVTAEVLAADGFGVHLLPEPLPTPVVAFAVGHLHAAAGIVVTASHNPPEDNGYKVYDASGRQIVAPDDAMIADAMAAVDRVADLPRSDPDHPDIHRLDDAVVEAYVDAAAGVVDPRGPRQVAVGYTAMHGVGAPVFRRAMARAGFAPPVEVAEQVAADPDFPTVAFPNPEEPGALDLGLALARRHRLDLLVAHDPDADRLGVAVPDPARGDPGSPEGWRVLRGDEIGVLLAHHLLVSGRLPANAVLATTIVSSTLLAKMAAAAGVPYVETLTGFKWISRAPGAGQVLGFGYEEALGYCVGGPVADKDGITAALVFAELVAAERAQGRSVLQVLDDLARRHGVHETAQRTVRVPGPDGAAVLAEAMARLRSAPPAELAGRLVERFFDLAGGDPDRGLPPTDVVVLEVSGGRVVVRPSGTEPKLKCYVEAVVAVGPAVDGLATARAEARSTVAALAEAIGAATGV
jgi:phosphomannomutase